MSSVAVRLAARELRHGLRGLRGFGVFIACLALGVAAIVGVQSTARSIVSGLEQDGRSILGGDIALRAVYRDLTVEERDQLGREVAEYTHFTELRTMAKRPGDEARVLVELKAVDGRWPLFGAFEGRGFDDAAMASLPQALARDDAGVWGAVVDPSLVDRLGLGPGDAATLAIGGIEFEVRGVIEREPDRAGSGGPFGLWPRVLVNYDAIVDSTLMREGSLVYHQYAVRLATEDDASLNAARARLSERLRDEGWRVRTYRDASPGMRRAVDRLEAFLSLVGLTALLVGGVGVGNAVRAWLDTRLETIAVLKCIGAPRRVVFRACLLQLMAFALVGVALGLVVGTLVPMAVSNAIAAVWPVPITVGIHPGVLALGVLFGLLTALTFTLWPLARAEETPPTTLFRKGAGGGEQRGRTGRLIAALLGGGALAALSVATASDRDFAAWFVIGAAATLVVFRGAGWGVVEGARQLVRRHAARFRHRFRMALSNLCRPANTTADIVLSLGLGLTVLVTVALVEENLRQSVAESLPEDAPAFFFVGVESDRIDTFTDVVTGIEGAEQFRSVPFLRGRIIRVNGRDPEEALINEEHSWVIRGDRGLSYATTAPDNPVVAGEWWPEDYAGPPLLSVDVDVIDAFELELGDSLTLNVLGREITARVQHVRAVEWQGMQLNFALLLSPEPLKRAPHGHVATVRADPATETRIERTLAREFPEITVVRTREALGRVAELMGNIAVAARLVGGVTLLAGALVLAGAVAAGHRRRTYESVVLKVLGVRRREVGFIHATEFALLGLLTGAIASGVGTVTAWVVVTQVLEQAWVFSGSAVAITVALCIALTLGLGLAGTWRALGESAAPFLRNE